MNAVILTNGPGGAGMPQAIEALAKGQPPLDVVEAAIRVVESDPSVRSVGLGGAPNILGEVECDASIMCGSTLRTGAVGALKHHVHAISIARQVMERTPHVMLVGDGALRFAREIGDEHTEMLTDEARADYEKWVSAHVPRDLMGPWPNVPLAPLVEPPRRDKPRGTVTFLVRTSGGSIAGGVSTSGWAYKYPGRLSDSCIIGAGLFVDDRYGAAGCTHTGEMAIRAGTARGIVTYMKRGATVEDACHEAFDDLRSLKGGFIGPLIVHAFDRSGKPYVLTTGGDGGATYWLWTEGMAAAERHTPIVEPL